MERREREYRTWINRTSFPSFPIAHSFELWAAHADITTTFSGGASRWIHRYRVCRECHSSYWYVIPIEEELISDILVRDPDPPMSSIYAVCDRVNQSQTPDSICKEAAKALRRHFKHGNEGERRAAAKIWLIMMRNIVNDVFRRMSSLLVEHKMLMSRSSGKQEIRISTRDCLASSSQ